MKLKIANFEKQCAKNGLVVDDFSLVFISLVIVTGKYGQIFTSWKEERTSNADTGMVLVWGLSVSKTSVDLIFFLHFAPFQY